MNKTVKKLGIILSLVILLPAVFFSVYELSSLSQNEKVIERIYNNQLEAILFSVNQYSEDVATSWSGKISALFENPTQQNSIDNSIKKFINENPSINFVFTSEQSSLNITDIYERQQGPEDQINKGDLVSVLVSNKGQITNLGKYLKKGYHKLEPVQSKSFKNITFIIFLTEDKNGKQILCGIAINSKEFIRGVLGPKIKSVIEDEFIASISKDKEHYDYNINSPSDINIIQQYKPLWFLPDYNLGIALKGGTIEDLVKERAKTNLILIVILIVLLSIGVWIVFRNIKKEIELAQIKSDFVSNVSHELRTPLALISMFSETLELGRVKSEERKKEYYTIISQETNRLGRIVNKILNFSKMEAGKRTYHFENTNINEVLENIFKTYKFHLENNGFKFELETSDNVKNFNCDSEAIAEAIINLIDNATKYSEKEKYVKIKSELKQNNIVITVEDHGIGIAPEDQKRIFEKFFRVSSGLVHNTKGTGLGLTLVKHIIQAHKGTISIESASGKGSKFILSFPLNNN